MHRFAARTGWDLTVLTLLLLCRPTRSVVQRPLRRGAANEAPLSVTVASMESVHKFVRSVTDAFRSGVRQLRRGFCEPYAVRLANAACEVLPIVVMRGWSLNIGNLGVVERWSSTFQSPMREIGARFLSSFNTLCISSTIIANR